VSQLLGPNGQLMQVPPQMPVQLAILGLRLRDLFALHSLSVVGEDPANVTDDHVAVAAYKLADAMIIARGE